MPSWNVTLTLILMASIGFVFWVMIRSQRQYLTTSEAAERSLAEGPVRRLARWARADPTETLAPDLMTGAVDDTSTAPDPMAEALAARLAARAQVAPDPAPPSTAGLPHVVVTAIEGANRVGVRNSSEGKVAVTLRAALDLALAGQFDEEVRVAVDAIDGVQAWHDIRKINNGGLTIAHLAVGPRGVFVIDSVVRSGRLSYDEDTVYIGRGSERTVDPMLDDLAVKVAAVGSLVDSVPVVGLIVVEDRLTLPAAVRSPGVTVRGVPLVTTALLAERLVNGLPLAAALDVEAIWARLFPAFEPAVDTPGHPFAVTTADTPQAAILLPR